MGGDDGVSGLLEVSSLLQSSSLFPLAMTAAKLLPLDCLEDIKTVVLLFMLKMKFLFGGVGKG